MRKYKVLKIILLIATTLFLVTAITFAILILCLKNECGCSNDNYYYIASVFAGLSIGLIPLVIFADTEVKHYYEKETQDYKSMREDLNYYIKIADEKSTSFVTTVLTGFGSTEGFDVLYEQFKRKEITLEQSYELMFNLFDINGTDWKERFILVVDSMTFILDEKEREHFRSCKENAMRKMLFRNKLSQLLNKFELLCYNFDKNVSSKQIFIDQIGHVILRIYFYALFLIDNNYRSEQFPYIEKMINYLLEKKKLRLLD